MGLEIEIRAVRISHDAIDQGAGQTVAVTIRVIGWEETDVMPLDHDYSGNFGFGVRSFFLGDFFESVVVVPQLDVVNILVLATANPVAVIEDICR